MATNIERKQKPNNVAQNNVKPNKFPLGYDLGRMAENVDYLAGRGSQTNPGMIFQNADDIINFRDHGKVFRSGSLEIPMFINPNILTYILNVNLEPYVEDTGITLIAETNSGGAITATNQSALSFGEPKTINLVCHRTTQAKTGSSNLGSTSGGFFKMPVTFSILAATPASPAETPNFRINSISVFEVSRNKMDIGGLSKDHPVSEVGSLGPGQYIYAQDLDAYDDFNPKKSIRSLTYGVSSSIQYGTRQAGLFYWTTIHRVTGVLNKSTNTTWQWVASSSNRNFFYQGQASGSIFPTNIWRNQQTASLNYAFYLYTTASNASTTASIDIFTSTGQTTVTCNLGTAAETRGLWFTGSFSGVKVTAPTTQNGHILPQGNSQSERINFALARTAGSGSVYCGGILIGEHFMGPALAHGIG